MLFRSDRSGFVRGSVARSARGRHSPMMRAAEAAGRVTSARPARNDRVSLVRGLHRPSAVTLASAKVTPSVASTWGGQTQYFAARAGGSDLEVHLDGVSEVFVEKGHPEFAIRSARRMGDEVRRPVALARDELALGRLAEEE